MNIVAEIRELAARLMESPGPVIGGPGPNQVVASSLFLMAHDIEARQGRDSTSLDTDPSPDDALVAVEIERNHALARVRFLRRMMETAMEGLHPTTTPWHVLNQALRSDEGEEAGF